MGRAVQILRRAARWVGDANTGLVLFDRCPEGAQHIEVIVDGAVADMAAAEVGNESLTDAVHERAAKKDGNAARTRVGVNISEVSLFDLCRIEGQYPFGLIVTDRNSVQLEQLPHNFDITNLGYVA